MDGVVEGGHRRIDQVLSPDFLDGLAGLAMPELRTRRDLADQEETDLSYLRRLLQARLDLVAAEIARRASGGAPPTDMVAYLAAVLSEPERAPARGSGRHAMTEPTRAGESRRYVEQLVSDALLTDLPGTDGADLTAAQQILTRGEETVSLQRSAVQRVLDLANAEIGRRYREGEASVSTRLAEGILHE